MTVALIITTPLAVTALILAAVMIAQARKRKAAREAKEKRAAERTARHDRTEDTLRLLVRLGVIEGPEARPEIEKIYGWVPVSWHSTVHPDRNNPAKEAE